MEENKKQEIKSVITTELTNYPNKIELAKHIEQGYIFGIFSTNEHYSLDEISILINEVLLETTNVPEYAKFINWVDPTCEFRISLSDASIKNIAINADALIQYVISNNLMIDNINGYAKVYVNFILPEHKNIFESFGGIIEQNPYPTIAEFDIMSTFELDEFKNSYELIIDGYDDMLEVDKCNAIKSIVYATYNLL